MPATKPRAKAAIGPPRSLTLDSGVYVLAAGSKIERHPIPPGPVLQRIVHKPPFGVGLRYGTDPHRVQAEENVNSLFGVLTRGPQKQSVTLPAGTVDYNRFQEMRGELYAMSRRNAVVAGQTVTKLYFHVATDDRSISTGLPTNFTVAGTGTMNPTIGAAQTSVSTTTTAAAIVAQRSLGPALASQTIAAQNWTLNIARSQSTNPASTVTDWGLRLYAFRPSTQTVVGYIVGSATAHAAYGSASENTVASTIQSFQDSVFAGSAVTVQNGDILVCEVTVIDSNPANPASVILYFDGTTETTTDNTTVTNHASFISSANNLTVSGAIPAKVAGRLAYFTTSNAFTDTTIDTDLGVNYVQGLAVSSQRLLALSAFPYSPTGGQKYSALAQSWDGLVWTSTNLQVQNQFLFMGISDVGGTIYILYADDISYPTSWTVAPLASGTLTGSTAVGLGTATATQASSVLPYRMASYPNSFAGTEVPWVFAADGLYELVGTAMVLMHRWHDGGGGYSGSDVFSGVVDGVDSLMWIDGETVWQGYWPPGGGPFIVRRHDPPPPFDGLPGDQQGPVTCFAVSEDKGCWVARGQGGGDSGHYGGIFIYVHRASDDEHSSEPELLHRPYENSTANRIIRAMTFTRENDGVSKLIFMEDNGTANDVSCFMFTYITDHPETVTGPPDTVAPYSFNAGGNVTFSVAKPLEGLSKVGWMAIGAETRGLSATKTITIQDGQDGTAPANAQTIDSTTDPPQVWPDKTDGSAGVGVSARSQQVVLTLVDSGGANTTSGPTVLEITETYLVKSLTPGGAIQEEIAFTVDLEASAARGTRARNPKNTWDDLVTTAAKNPLVALVLPGGETIQVSVEVSAELDGQLQNPVQQGPAGGTARVVCRKLLR